MESICFFQKTLLFICFGAQIRNEMGVVCLARFFQNYWQSESSLPSVADAMEFSGVPVC